MSKIRFAEALLKQSSVWYIVGIIVVLVLVIGLVVIRGVIAKKEQFPTTAPTANDVDQRKEKMITEEKAIEQAKKRLTRVQAPFEDRKVTISLENDIYTVEFHPPAGMRAGTFTVTVDANTGEVLEAIIRR